MESVITVQIAPTFSSKRRIARTSGLALFLLRAIKLRSTRWMKALVHYCPTPASCLYTFTRLPQKSYRLLPASPPCYAADLRPSFWIGLHDLFFGHICADKCERYRHP